MSVPNEEDSAAELARRQWETVNRPHDPAVAKLIDSGRNDSGYRRVPDSGRQDPPRAVAPLAAEPQPVLIAAIAIETDCGRWR